MNLQALKCSGNLSGIECEKLSSSQNNLFCVVFDEILHILDWNFDFLPNDDSGKCVFLFQGKTFWDESWDAVYTRGSQNVQKQ